MDFFDQNSFTIFLMLAALIYVFLSSFVQKKFGKSERLLEINKELNSISKKVGEASKRKDMKEMDELMKKQSPLLNEMMGIQMRLLPLSLALFLPLVLVLTSIEPYTYDDFKVQLYDDGLASHCDLAANDLTYSNCLLLNGTHKGAWVFSAEALINNAQVAQNSTAFYVEGGKPSDVFLQQKQHGLLEFFLGSKTVFISPYTDMQNYSFGQTAMLRAKTSESVESASATINNGTFYFVDLPIPIPILNIQRLVGATGVFILFTFVFSIIVSILKGILKKANVNIPLLTDKPQAQNPPQAQP